MQDLLFDAGSTSYKDELAVLVMVHATCPSAQLNDLGINSLLPPFLGTLNMYVPV